MSIIRFKYSKFCSIILFGICGLVILIFLNESFQELFSGNGIFSNAQNMDLKTNSAPTLEKMTDSFQLPLAQNTGNNLHASSMLDTLAAIPGFELGAGRINGRNTPIAVIKGINSAEQLWQSVLERCKNRCTPSLESGPLGPVIMLFDVKSEYCPKCPEPNIDTMSETISKAVVISFISMGNIEDTSINDSNQGSIAIASLAGPIGDGILSKSSTLVYEGQLFNKPNAAWSLEQQSTFIFGDSHIHNTDFSTKDMSSSILSLFESLKQEGFKPLTPDDRLPKELIEQGIEAQSKNSHATLLTDLSGSWAKGDNLVQFHIFQELDPKTNKNFVKVRINEISL